MMTLVRAGIDQSHAQEAPMALEHTIADAEASIDAFTAYLSPIETVRRNLRPMAQAVLTDATAEAEAIIAAATAKASEIVATAGAEAEKEQASAAAAKAEHERLAHEIGDLSARRDTLAGVVATNQAQLDQINAEVAATLAKFAPKA
jgi:chromosome segregation ATPase